MLLDTTRGGLIAFCRHRSRSSSARRRKGNDNRHVSLINSSYARRLRVEQLEDRRLLAVLAVSSLGDAGAGTLREALTIANGNGQDDMINFTVSGTIPLAAQLPTITDDVIIDGVVNIRESTFSGNSGGDGGAMSLHDGNFLIENSTLSGNLSAGNGSSIDHLQHTVQHAANDSP